MGVGAPCCRPPSELRRNTPRMAPGVAVDRRLSPFACKRTRSSTHSAGPGGDARSLPLHCGITRSGILLALNCVTGGRIGGTAAMVEVTADRSRAERISVEAIHEHGATLLATARLFTHSDAEAQDLVQTTFEIALRRLDTLRDPHAIRSWLLRIETREALRLRRRLSRLVRFDHDRHDIADPFADPSRWAEEADLRAALGKLSLRVRAAVILHHMAGLPVHDTALALGVSDNTAKTQLKTGLARLREALDHD